jgi:hypothetical protein
VSTDYSDELIETVRMAARRKRIDREQTGSTWNE